MKLKKIIVGGIIGITILSQSSVFALADTIQYDIKQGDTYWKISERYDIDLKFLLESNSITDTNLIVGQTINLPYDSQNKILYRVKWGDTYWKVSQAFDIDINTLLSANNANASTQLVVNDVIIIPKASNNKVHIVQSGDTYWKISDYYNVDLMELLEINNANQYSELNIGQKVTIPEASSGETSTNPIENSSGPSITYTNYTVQKGDNFWSISIKFGIPQYELLKANSANQYTMLNIGDVIKIPVHNVPIKATPGAQYGEYLDWWTEAQYVIPINKVFKVRDYYTGKEWNMKRTIGANHADCEPLTSSDAEIMKQVWGGNYSWATRPVIIIVDGRKIAASASSMPHDIQYISNNGFNGHIDIHFANSTRHKDGQIDYNHQENIKIAAGLK